MKTGIIIVFNAAKEDIPTGYFIKYIHELLDVKFCLVNNNKSDKMYESLLEISDHCINANVINIRKIKTNTSAVRAGARYMFNQFNLKHLGYIVDSNIVQILEAIALFTTTQNEIQHLNCTAQSNQVVKKTFFQSLFSLTERLENLKSVS